MRLQDDPRFASAHSGDLRLLEDSPGDLDCLALVYRQLHPGVRSSLLREVKFRCPQGDNVYQHLERQVSTTLSSLVHGYVDEYSNMLMPFSDPYVNMIHTRDTIETYRLMNGGSWGRRTRPDRLERLLALDEVMSTLTPTYRCSPLYWCGRPIPTWERRRRNWWVWWYAPASARPVTPAAIMFQSGFGTLMLAPRRPTNNGAPIPGYCPPQHFSGMGRPHPYYPEVDFICTPTTL